jgi:murein DD-endopeptidase MepM/ murein hydrolase activator NlpD
MMTRRRLSVALVVLLVSGVAGCGGGDSSSPTAPTSVATPPSNPTASESGGNPGITVDGISLSDLPATQTMSVMPFDPAAVTIISPFRPSHTGIDINTITGGHFLSPGTGIVTKIELNTGQGLPGGTNYRIRLHLTSTGLTAIYHFEVHGSISDQTQQDNILVALGDRVTAGQHIGNLVSLGEHAHVHFDMLDAGGRDAVRCPSVYFTPEVWTAWETLYDAKIRERDTERIKNNRGPVPSLPDLCNEVDTPSS